MDEPVIRTTESPMSSAMLGAMLGNDRNNDLTTLLAANVGGLGSNNLALIILLLLLGGNGWNGNNNAATATQVQDNHNSNLVMQALSGNNEAIQRVSNMLGATSQETQQALCLINSTIQGMNGDVKLAITSQGYQNQLANCEQTNTMLQGFNNLNNSVVNGFTSLGYQVNTLGCEIKQTSSDNTQRIIDTLNNHWNLEQQSTIAQLRDEIGRRDQTAALITALGSTSTARTTTTATT